MNTLTRNAEAIRAARARLGQDPTKCAISTMITKGRIQPCIVEYAKVRDANGKLRSKTRVYNVGPEILLSEVEAFMNNLTQAQCVAAMAAKD